MEILVGNSLNTKLTLRNLIDIINKRYNDVLDDTVGEDDLWGTIRLVREQLIKGRRLH